MQFRSAKTIVRGVLFVFCSLAALSTAGAVEKPPLPEVVHIEHNGAFYKIDYSDFTGNRFSSALGGGCYEVALSRRSGDGGKTTWRGVFTRTICLDDWGVTIRDAAGPDSFEFGIPKAALLPDVRDITGDVMVSVSVNGHVEELKPALFYQLATSIASGALPTGVEDYVEFANLARHYSEDGWYHQALPVFQTLQEEVADRYLIPEPDGLVPTCWQPCTTCGLSALGTVVGGTALAATCATTFGATCVGGAVGVVSLALRTVVACDACRICRGDDPRCSPGYSTCCENQCCKDGVPLPDCDPDLPEE